MTQFITAIDPSAERRAQFMRRAQQALESSDGASVQVVEQDGWTMISLTRPWEPLRTVKSSEGVSFLWGWAMECRQSVSQVPDLTSIWRSLPDRLPPPLEGLHVACLFRADGSWTVGADILGLMPVYYWCAQDIVLVGSSPALFDAHPLFRRELDVEGLAGLLLTNGLVDGRSLVKGVRRLDAGRLLHASRQQSPRELVQYIPEMSDRYFGASFEENCRRLEQTLEDCFTRHIDPARRYGLILSGGLDSRWVGGIVKQYNVTPTAFSFGSKSDIEMQCAVAVAKSLRFEHHMIPERVPYYPEYAQREYKWNHLANGMSTLLFHEPIPDAARFDGGMLSGFSMDHLIGGSAIAWGGEDPERMCFENFFKRLNRWGMPVPTVKGLLAKNFDTGIVERVVQRLHQTYHEGATREFQKVWLAINYHRVRYHVSSVLGLHGHWPWPVVPYLDTALLDLIGGFPYEHIKARRLQYHIIKQRFPELARVPLDRNSFNMKPLASPYGRVMNHLLFKPKEIFYRWTSAIRERRFYYRSMDFDSPGWRAVRSAAEPHREKASKILDATALAQVLPVPGERAAVRDGIIDTAKMKLMSGFLLWSAEYL